jgi:hypothetical protein
VIIPLPLTVGYYLGKEIYFASRKYMMTMLISYFPNTVKYLPNRSFLLAPHSRHIKY